MVEFTSLDNSSFNGNIVKLYKIVRDVESGNDALAIRFEPHYLNRIKDNDKAVVRAKRHVYGYTTSIKAYLSFSVSRLQFLVYNLYHIDTLYEYLRNNSLLPVSIPFAIEEKHEIILFDLFLKERLLGFYAKLKSGSVNLEDFKEFGRRWNGAETYGEKIFKRFTAQ